MTGRRDGRLCGRGLLRRLGGWGRLRGGGLRGRLRLRPPAALRDLLLALCLAGPLSLLQRRLPLGLLLLALLELAPLQLLAGLLSLLALARRRGRGLSGCASGRLGSGGRRLGRWSHGLGCLVPGSHGTRGRSRSRPALCGGIGRCLIRCLLVLRVAAATEPERGHHANRRMSAANGQFGALSESDRSASWRFEWADPLTEGAADSRAPPRAGRRGRGSLGDDRDAPYPGPAPAPPSRRDL